MKGLESQEQDLFYKSITMNTRNFFTQEPAATDSKQKALKANGNLLAFHSSSYHAKAGSVT